jgi:hypothetical protein
MLEPGSAPAYDIHDNGPTRHVDTGSAAADQLDTLDGRRLYPRQDVRERLRLRDRLLAVDQHIAGRTGIASHKARAGDAEAGDTLHHIERVLRLALTEEIRGVADHSVCGAGRGLRQSRGSDRGDRCTQQLR